jgi:hypothetical protein
MAVIVIVLLALHMVSLLTMGVVVLAYRQLETRQKDFYASIIGSHDMPPIVRRHWVHQRIIVWCYVIITIVITVASTALFVFQPHVF